MCCDTVVPSSVSLLDPLGCFELRGIGQVEALEMTSVLSSCRTKMEVHLEIVIFMNRWMVQDINKGTYEFTKLLKCSCVVTKGMHGLEKDRETRSGCLIECFVFPVNLLVSTKV